MLGAIVVAGSILKDSIKNLVSEHFHPKWPPLIFIGGWFLSSYLNGATTYLKMLSDTLFNNDLDKCFSKKEDILNEALEYQVSKYSLVDHMLTLIIQSQE